MRKFALAHVVCTASVVLSGCVSWPWTPQAQGCGVQFKQGGNWSIAGVDIPINHPLVGTVKLGNVTYTGADYSKISDTVRALDQARLGYCSLITSPNFHLVSQDVKDDTFKKAAASNSAIVNFGIGLKTATTPEEGRTAQQAAAQVVKELKPTSPGAFIDNDARVAAAEAANAASAAATAVADLGSKVTRLDQDLAEVRKISAQRIRVTGFEPNGSALLAGQRAAILADFRQAISAVPAGRTPSVLFIGYADGSGLHINNVDLALRRATNVAEFLRRHEFGREFHTEVTSGGVASQSSGEHARRVDIVVSRLTLGLQTTVSI